MIMSETPLTQIIRNKIKADGPMPLSTYMGLCLGHPEHGYYMTRDPFGKAGDFTTAPEISQMFGEMIGAWVVDTWQKIGAPEKFVLLEMGPGRGTLMEDILRVAWNVDGFRDAVQVHLMEMSPVLRKAQEKALIDYKPTWHMTLESVASLEPSVPVIAIGNEFLDALPVDQYTLTDTGWAQKHINFNINGSFRIHDYPLVDSKAFEQNDLPNTLFKHSLGDVVEVSHEQKKIMSDLIDIIINQGGGCLLIDYGFSNNGCGDTLQAVKDHAYCDVLEMPGECDITYHINFSNLTEQIMAKNLMVHGPVSQSTFLKTLGIEMRAEALKQSASNMNRPDMSQSIEAALTRLIDKDQMGDLFKVIAFSSDSAIQLAGFSE